MTDNRSCLNNNGFNAAKLNRLRRTLYEAEKDVLCKQAEIETLQRTFLSDLDQDVPFRRCSFLARDRSCSSLAQNRRESFTSYPPRKLASDIALNVSSKNDAPFTNGTSEFRSRWLNSIDSKHTVMVQNVNDRKQGEEKIAESVFVEKRCLLLHAKEEMRFIKQLLHRNSLDSQRDRSDFNAQILALEKKFSALDEENSDRCINFEQISNALTELRKLFIDNWQKFYSICDRRLSNIVDLAKLNSVIDNYDQFLNKSTIFARLDLANLVAFKTVLEDEDGSDRKLNVTIFLLLREIAFHKLELLTVSKLRNVDECLTKDDIFEQDFETNFVLKNGVHPESFGLSSLIDILKSRYFEYRALKSELDRRFISGNKNDNDNILIDNVNVRKLRDLFAEAPINSADSIASITNKNRGCHSNGKDSSIINIDYLETLLRELESSKELDLIEENVDFETSIRSCIWEILYLDLNPRVFRPIIKAYLDSNKNETVDECSHKQQLHSLESEFEAERRKFQNEIRHLRNIVEVASNSQNLDKEIAELEQELVEIQTACNDEIRILKDFYESKLSDKEKELLEEKHRRKKLTKDMLEMKIFVFWTLNDESLQTILNNQSELINELKKKHLKEISRISKEYEQKLFEEKEATKFALDALQKAHELEMNNQVMKLRSQHQLSSSPHNDSELASFELCTEKKRYKKIQNAVEKENEEISRLTMAYSAKCIEITMLEDYLAEYRSVLDKKISACDTEESAEFLKSLMADIEDLDKNLINKLDLCASGSAPSMIVENGHVPLRISASENGPSSQNSIDDCSFDRQDEVTPTKRMGPLRRHSERYHSTPNIRRNMDCRSAMNIYPEILEEMNGAAPVSERRKFFEHFK